PEIMDATLRIILAAGANLKIETIQVGESVYRSGITSGIEPSAWESLRRTRVFLKAPITTPEGGGYKSLNVTVRKTLGLYANVRQSLSYHPFVATKHPDMDVVIVRENEEDLYGGIEHRQTGDVFQCLKLISRPGSERLIRYAFEYARRYGRKKVTCFTKDNIMKMTDGLFHAVFDEVSKEYPDIKSEHWIVDIGAAKLADKPEEFDLIVLPNLYGDILSDVSAQIAGSVGLAGSANIGDQLAMFEAIHGSAPRRAGQNLANPSGLLLAAVQMLVHIGQGKVAERVHNAWLKTIEDGVHTYDIYNPAVSKKKVGTREFADAVIERLGQQPTTLKPVDYPTHSKPIEIKLQKKPKQKKQLVGVDVFVDFEGKPEDLGRKLDSISAGNLKLLMITNRGTKVYPGGVPETFCVDHWRCRFQAPGNNNEVKPENVVELMSKLIAVNLPPVKTEGLFTFDGKPGFSLGQGQ
ncbi:MAG: NADP-dependent isocitrate dehydrogenase, partial [Candidatus Thermoplasmatota archaeon]|nr:NADP-dependent isocitrate dehydrogenase [Candidatus Thermoplasmatota archaeon]